MNLVVTPLSSDFIKTRAGFGEGGFRGGGWEGLKKNIAEPCSIFLKSLQTLNVYIRGGSSLYFCMANGSATVNENMVLKI